MALLAHQSNGFTNMRRKYRACLTNILFYKLSIWSYTEVEKDNKMKMTRTRMTMMILEQAETQLIYHKVTVPLLLSLILGTWSLSNLKGNWLLSLGGGSNWADFEQMMIRQNGDVPSPLLRDSGNMITFTGEPDNAGARITHHQGWISKKPPWGDFDWSGVRPVGVKTSWPATPAT